MNKSSISREEILLYTTLKTFREVGKEPHKSMLIANIDTGVSELEQMYLVVMNCMKDGAGYVVTPPEFFDSLEVLIEEGMIKMSASLEQFATERSRIIREYASWSEVETGEAHKEKLRSFLKRSRK